MQTKSFNTAETTAGAPRGPVFSKEAAALLSGTKALSGNAMEAVSHAMMFR